MTISTEIWQFYYSFAFSSVQQFITCLAFIFVVICLLRFTSLSANTHVHDMGTPDTHFSAIFISNGFSLRLSYDSCLVLPLLPLASCSPLPLVLLECITSFFYNIYVIYTCIYNANNKYIKPPYINVFIL